MVRAQVLARFPHDSDAFTEGLFYHDGALFESSGLVGRSEIRKVDLKTGKVLRSVKLPPSLFGEGIVDWKGEIVSVTWKARTGFRWRMRDFKRLSKFSYPGEGWGMTHNATDLILSDGTADLRFLNPQSFALRHRLRVTYRGRPLTQLNELEWVDGSIFANVWQQNAIVRIDPKTGKVTQVIDVSALTAEADAHGEDPVPNGIAWDAKHHRLFVTGKNWPILFQIALPPAP